MLIGTVAASGGLAAPAPKRIASVPQAVVGEIKLTLQRVEAERTATARLDSMGLPAGQVRGSMEVRLELQLSSRYPATLSTVRRGPVELTSSFRVVDNLGKETRDAHAQVLDEESGPVLRITARGLTSTASSLRLVVGSILLFPEARVVRFHVPWLKDSLPLTTESTGAVATLRRFQLVQEDSTLWISVRPPSGLQVAPFELPGSVEARAMDLYGNLVNNGGITQIEQINGGGEPEYRFSAPAMRRTPARLTLDVLCIRGSPAAKPFQMHNLPLPVLPR